MLDVAKIDAGAMSVELESFSPSEMIRAIVQMLGAQLLQKDLMTEIVIDPMIDVIRADQRKFKQILMNLLSNAIKYTPNEGMITIRGILSKDQIIQFEVADTGVGIASEDQAMIFSEFQQADRKRDGQLGGTGIGLALARRLVEMHGGEIGVESTLHVGSRFWFTLPSAYENLVDLSESDYIRRVSVVRSGGNKILVAEDNDVNLALLLDLLSIHEHDVVVARNGREAVDLARSHKPDLILMDIAMPILDGSAATKEILAIPELKNVPIVALTASVHDQFLDELISIGFVDHISKPIQMTTFFQTLEKHLDRF